jgi:hypothetical protein
MAIFHTIVAAGLALLLWQFRKDLRDRHERRYYKMAAPTLGAMCFLMAVTAVGYHRWATTGEGFHFLASEFVLVLATFVIGARWASMTRLSLITGFSLMVAIAALSGTEMAGMREVQEYRGSVVKLQRVQGHGTSSVTNYLTLENKQGIREWAISGMPGRLGWLDLSNGPVPVRIEYIYHRYPWGTESITEIIGFAIETTASSVEASSPSR